ncbi:hypothetical protein Q5752_002330 [Cryptotrichosporon argae]
MTGINALCYVAATIPPWILTDRAGRRPILLTGATAMAIALTATGWWIYIDQAITPKAVIYNAAFGMSWGPIPWLYPPEIMPLPFRAKGVSISTATNYWVGVSTPLFQELIGWRLYPMHAFFCVLSFVLVYPETRGVPLEEMDKLFGDDVSPDDGSDEDDDDDDERSETSSLANSLHGQRGGSRSASRASHGSSLPTSRKRSPLPGGSRSRDGVFAMVANAVDGLLQPRPKRATGYNAISAGHEE